MRSLCGEWAHSEVAPIEAVLSLIYSLAEIIQVCCCLTSNCYKFGEMLAKNVAKYKSLLDLLCAKLYETLFA